LLLRDGKNWQNWLSFNCGMRSEMIAHIEKHRAAGHRVQDEVIAVMRDEIESSGDAV
jgi:hypothetical protein